MTTQNSGKNTPGIDGTVVVDNQSREILSKTLQAEKLPSAQPVKRVFIPKEKGTVRPLGIATIRDRCRQVIVQTALEPYWEAKFEATSYGFRPGRGAHDAMQKIFCIARSGKGKPWVLDADIKGAFDNINHAFLMDQLKGFPARKQIEKWLKAGICYNNQFVPTQTGVQQGGPISPLLLNITLHGMETALGVLTQKHVLIEKSPYAVVRYADDLLVFAKTQEACQIAKIKLNTWLADRGLALSEEKTNVVHLEEGFDFLGFNVRRYKTNRTKKGTILLIKPSKKSINNFRQMVRQTWIQVLGWKKVDAIRNLNKKITGWGNYFKTSAAKKIFSSLDDWMFKRQVRYLYRTHPKKSWNWYRSQYYGTIKGRKDRWVFQDKISKIYLEKLSWIPIRRHIMVKNVASPDNPQLRDY